ncbi:MAG: DUF91 domain-containing protein [Rikenellaceae bacterium]|nr:DUF91 domain-containing protein [Rikenellaceae bacterium]
MTTHVFIVDEQSFKVHLEYMFVGTGAVDNDKKDKDIDFNGVANSNLHHQRENGLVSMMSDFSRVRIGDYVLFYVQSAKGKDGKFYGIYKINSTPFHEPSGKNQYLRNSLGKNLTFRALIKPYKVYAEGITEWEALDEIKGINAPNQMVWSLIYRKLKGNRGNTMVTMYEAERLFNLIMMKNGNRSIAGVSYSYNKQQQITLDAPQKTYTGNTQEIFNVLHRLMAKKHNNQAFEAHLQMFITQNLCSHPSLKLALKVNTIEWLGNEVSCGVGMQRIDVMFSQYVNDIEREIVPIELKAVHASKDHIKQISRYIKWIEQYYVPNRPSTIRPVLICKASTLSAATRQAFYDFNAKYDGRCLPLEYIEFSDNGTDLIFTNTPY